MQDFIRGALQESRKALDAFIENDGAHLQIERAAELLVQTVRNKGRIFSCGNGGSMADAMHFAEEFTGRFRRDRAPLPATAICDPTHITCVANDFGFDFIFSTYIQGCGRPGDVLLALSTSGKSKNIIEAVQAAKQQNMKTILLTGVADAPLVEKVDVPIVTPGGRYADRVQELHIKTLHILVELTERQLFPENYQAK